MSITSQALSICTNPGPLTIAGSFSWVNIEGSNGSSSIVQIAHVVVFGGPYTWFRDGQVYQHVVCVVQADDIYLYPSVNLTGSAFQ